MVRSTTVLVDGRRYQVIHGSNGDLVSSLTVTGAYHQIRNRACDCDGFKYRGRCSHLRAVDTATTPAEPPKPLTLMDLYDD